MQRLERKKMERKLEIELKTYVEDSKRRNAEATGKPNHSYTTAPPLNHPQARYDA